MLQSGFVSNFELSVRVYSAPLRLAPNREPIRPRSLVSTRANWRAMGTPIQFGPLRLNEPFELPSEFMFWLFPRRIAGFKEGNF